MILNWKKTAMKLSKVHLFYFQQVFVKRLTHINFSTAGEHCYEGEPVPGAERDEVVECHDGLYLVQGESVIVKGKPGVPEIRVRGAGLFQITGNKVRLMAQAGGDDWPLKLRDVAAELLKQQPDPLAKFTEEELERALAARRAQRGNKPEKAKRVIVGKQVR